MGEGGEVGQKADVGTSTGSAAMLQISRVPSTTSVLKSEKQGSPRKDLSQELLQELRSMQKMEWTFHYTPSEKNRAISITANDIREDRQHVSYHDIGLDEKETSIKYADFLQEAKDREAKEGQAKSSDGVIEGLLLGKSLNDQQLFEALRFRGKNEQVEEPIWKLLMDIVKDHSKVVGGPGGAVPFSLEESFRKDILERLCKYIWGKDESNPHKITYKVGSVNPFLRGPMGDLPFHNCFLLAYAVPEGPHRKLMLGIGMMLIEKFHIKVDEEEDEKIKSGQEEDEKIKSAHRKEMYGVSAHYTSDIEKWKNVKIHKLKSLQRILWPPKDGEEDGHGKAPEPASAQEAPPGMWHQLKTLYERAVGLYADPVNDGGLYTGETVLHIAIANQDFDTAKKLVDTYKADINAKATGAFFKPTIERIMEDRRGGGEGPKGGGDGRDHSQGEVERPKQGMLSWWPFGERQRTLRIVPNKEGAFEDGDSYFGETPLCFAVVFGNLALMRMLIDSCRKRAFDEVMEDPKNENEKETQEKLKELQDKSKKAATKAMVKFVNQPDQFGNTPMHIAVLHKRKEAFDLLAENEGDMTVTNHQGLTPFTLAARLGFTAIFEHILDRHYRRPVWSYGGVKLVKTDLTQVDSFKLSKMCTCVKVKATDGKRDVWDRRKCAVDQHRECTCLKLDVEKSCKVATHKVCKCKNNPENRTKPPEDKTHPPGTLEYPLKPWGECPVEFHAEQASCKCTPDDEAKSETPGAGRGTSGEQCKVEGHTQRKLHNGGWKGALEIIVDHEVVAFADQELIRKMVQDKWLSYGRWHYVVYHLLPYLAFMILFTAMVTLRCSEARRDWNEDIAAGFVQPSDVQSRFTAWWLGIWAPLPGGGAGGRWLTLESSLLQLCVTLFSALVLFLDGVRHARLSPTDLDPQQRGWRSLGFTSYGRFVHKNLTSALCVCIVLLLLAALACRMLGLERDELSLLAVSCILVFCGLLQRLMPFEFFGRLVIMIWRIFLHDVLLALFIYLILLCAFALALFVMWQRSDFPSEMMSRGGAPLDADPSHTFLELIWVSLGEVDISSVIMATHNSSLAFSLHIIWIILSDVLVLNLLIAMMGRTYDQDTRDGHTLWFFPHAAEVLWLEKNLGPKNKARFRTGRPANNDNDLLEVDQACASVFWWFDFVHIHAGDQGNHKGVQAVAGPHWADQSTSEQERDNRERVEHARRTTEMLKELNGQLDALKEKVPDGVEEQVREAREQTFERLKASQEAILGGIEPVRKQLDSVWRDVEGMRDTTQKLGQQVRGALGLKSDPNDRLAKLNTEDLRGRARTKLATVRLRPIHQSPSISAQGSPTDRTLRTPTPPIRG